jgi:hypothetical protein
MITLILTKLNVIMDSAAAAGGAGGPVDISNIVTMFEVESMIPPYFLQLCVGIYIVQIIFILTLNP